MRSADELRALVERYLEELELAPELGGLSDPMRYALEGGGKRIRPVVCLAVADALGHELEDALPAAAALELVHTFSLVHDDLPALDDDDVRRGRPSTHVQFGDGVAVIAGDALLAEAFRLALSYTSPGVARELVEATLGMISGQYLDVTGGTTDELALSRLKTGRLFEAAVACALEVTGVPEVDRRPWQAFAADVGVLFQLVDDILDGDGYAARHGLAETRRAADAAGERAHAHLAETAVDTSVLADIVDGLTARSS
jgi:geranylgeranyl diphosphate synthase, type II